MRVLSEIEELIGIEPMIAQPIAMLSRFSTFTGNYVDVILFLGAGVGLHGRAYGQALTLRPFTHVYIRDLGANGGDREGRSFQAITLGDFGHNLGNGIDRERFCYHPIHSCFFLLG